jgi:hypothetical protein
MDFARDGWEQVLEIAGIAQYKGQMASLIRHAMASQLTPAYCFYVASTGGGSLRDVWSGMHKS